MKKRKPYMIFMACLGAFTLFIAMDTFVLSSPYQTNATEMNTAMFDEVSAGQEDDHEEGDSVKAVSGEERSAEDTQEVGKTDIDGSGETGGETDTDGSRGSGEEKGSDSSRGSGEEKGSDSSWGSGEEKNSDDGQGSDDMKKKHKPGRRKKGGDEAGKDSGNGLTENNSDNGTSEDESEEKASASLTGTGTSYKDENKEITISEYTVNGTTVHVADVQLTSAQYLKTAFADDTYGKNVTEKTSEIAAAHDAVLAINGDYYGTQETGYVIRNGIVYRDQAGKSDVLCIYADGTMKVVSPSEYTAQELVDQGVWQAFSFGPALVEEGKVAVSEDTEVGKAMASNPRTAIGIIDDLHYVFVVSDGRTDESEGLSLYELAGFMEEELGVGTAYNLDGGGSSTMYFEGSIINNPTTNGRIKERSVSDIVYI